jgi:hypothetical protein
VTANERVAQLHQLSKVYAKAKAECEYLKHFRKSKLAILKKKYAVENPKLSNAALDDMARADDEYIEVLTGMRAATEISEAAFWELTISKSGIQIWQTKQADRRAEMNIR